MKCSFCEIDQPDTNEEQKLMNMRWHDGFEKFSCQECLLKSDLKDIEENGLIWMIPEIGEFRMVNRSKTLYIQLTKLKTHTKFSFYWIQIGPDKFWGRGGHQTKHIIMRKIKNI